MWFDKSDIRKYDKIILDNLHGYVLPHAGTKYTGHILSHTLRFIPKKPFSNILIIYLPSNSEPNVGKYYHEYYVPYKTLQLFYPNKKFIGFNMLQKSNTDISMLSKKDTLYIVSADFSHFLSLNDAISKENCAAHSLILKKLSQSCNSVVDDIRSFEKMYQLLPKIILQWVGRTRSIGEKGVGYLSFLLRDTPNLKIRKPNGFFVTAYDEDARQRECLGNTNSWNEKLEKDLVKNVIRNAKKTSRLTGGKYLNRPITNYIITYLYKDKSVKFIRGWHSILMNALYLSDVFLENTYDNGDWFKSDNKTWKNGNIFNLEPTKKKLIEKAHSFGNIEDKNKYQLFTSQIKPVNIILIGGKKKYKSKRKYNLRRIYKTKRKYKN